MTDSVREFARVRNPVLLLAALAWIVLIVEPGNAGVAAHCAPSSTPAGLAAGWALMLVAMMAPALIPPVAYIRFRSFAHRRARSIALFATGYAAIWMAIGGVMLALEREIKLLAPQSYLPAGIVALIAAVWQFSPAKQRCLNRCHAHTAIAAFGAEADRDALRFGITHGIWCAGSCWALMLVPMLLPRGHTGAMAVAAVLIFAERLESPMPPRWRRRGIGKLVRIAVAQTRIRMGQAAALSSSPARTHI